VLREGGSTHESRSTVALARHAGLSGLSRHELACKGAAAELTLFCSVPPAAWKLGEADVSVASNFPLLPLANNV